VAGRELITQDPVMPMTFVLRSCLLGAFVACTAALPARADGVDEVKEKLFQAKKEYDGEVSKFRRAVTESLDKREDAARKAGDKKALDAVKVDRDRFDNSGELPTDCPKGPLTQIGAARTKLDKAYSAAIKDLVKLKEDAVAEAAEKEQNKFVFDSAFLLGKRTHLVTLKHFDVKTNNNNFSDDGSVPGRKYKLTLNGAPATRSIFLRAPAKGIAQVSYALDGKWTALRASVGVPKIEEKTGDPASPLTFEVLGDGKSLWKSEPVTKVEVLQTCELRVEKVKTLTLRVHCPGSDAWNRSVWFEPILAE
jgi:hypothetical protein